jgi:hypothetical protein
VVKSEIVRPTAAETNERQGKRFIERGYFAICNSEASVQIHCTSCAVPFCREAFPQNKARESTFVSAFLNANFLYVALHFFSRDNFLPSPVFSCLQSHGSNNGEHSGGTVSSGKNAVPIQYENGIRVLAQQSHRATLG